MDSQTSGSSSPFSMQSSPLLSAFSPASPASSFSQLLLPPFEPVYYPPPDFFPRRFEADFSPDDDLRDSGLLAPPPSPLPSFMDPLHVFDGNLPASLDPLGITGQEELVPTENADVFLSFPGSDYVNSDVLANARSFSFSDALWNPIVPDVLQSHAENDVATSSSFGAEPLLPSATFHDLMGDLGAPSSSTSPWPTLTETGTAALSRRRRPLTDDAAFPFLAMGASDSDSVGQLPFAAGDWTLGSARREAADPWLGLGEYQGPYSTCCPRCGWSVSTPAYDPFASASWTSTGSFL